MSEHNKDLEDMLTHVGMLVETVGSLLSNSIRLYRIAFSDAEAIDEEYKSAIQAESYEAIKAALERFDFGFTAQEILSGRPDVAYDALRRCRE